MLLALLTPALAGAIPAWHWPPGEVQRFHIETELVTPRGVRYNAAENIDARAGIVKIRADTACTAKPDGKGNIVTCTFAYIDMKAQPQMPDEAPKLDKIMEEWTVDLAGTTVELELGADGRLKYFDTKAKRVQTTQREGYNLEQQRILLQRVFAPLDFPITTDDKDWVRGWSQKSPSALMVLQTISGTVGAVEMKHKHIDDQDGMPVIETTARATLSAGAAVDAGSGGRQIDVKLAGQTIFDATRGMMMWRDFVIDGRLTVSSQLAGDSREYSQVGAIQWVPEFPVPGEIPPSLTALRAPKLDGKAPDVVGEQVLFSSLGMNPLYVEGHPEGARSLQLGKTKVKARVVVGADGLTSSAKAFEGYAALGPATEAALGAARFPARGAAYTVDVEVEWRPTDTE